MDLQILKVGDTGGEVGSTCGKSIECRCCNHSWFPQSQGRHNDMQVFQPFLIDPMLYVSSKLINVIVVLFWKLGFLSVQVLDLGCDVLFVLF